MDTDVIPGTGPGEARSPRNPAHAFLVELGRVMHSQGASSPDLERAIRRCARHLGVEGQFLSTPTSLLLGFEEHDGQRTYLARVEPAEVDLGKLVDLEKLIDRIAQGDLDAPAARVELAAIERATRRYRKRTTVFAFALASASAARFFDGGYADIVASALLAAAIGAMAIFSSSREALARVLEPASAALASALAVGIAALWPELQVGLVTVASVIILLPGLTFTVAIEELAQRHLVAGTARLFGAASTFLSLTLGVALGRILARSWTPAEAQAIEGGSLPGWTLLLALLFAPIGFGVLFRARPRDLHWVCVAGWLAFSAARFGNHHFGPELGAGFGALSVGLFANFLAIRGRYPAALAQLPGLLLLVPGSLGFRSLTSFMDREPVVGLESAFGMAMVATGLVGGLLLANALLPARRRDELPTPEPSR